MPASICFEAQSTAAIYRISHGACLLSISQAGFLNRFTRIRGNINIPYSQAELTRIVIETKIERRQETRYFNRYRPYRYIVRCRELEYMALHIQRRQVHGANLYIINRYTKFLILACGSYAIHMHSQ